MYIIFQPTLKLLEPSILALYQIENKLQYSNDNFNINSMKLSE